MRFARVFGVVGGGLLIGSLGSVTGCSTADEPRVATAETVSSASVALTLHDANGTRVGEGSGILIAPRLVLTSAHLVAGKARWTVKTSDGKTANGVRGLTYDWMVYGSNKSHPRKHDVAVVYLDQPIELPMYPKLATTRLAAGSKATRVRGTGAGFESIATTLDAIRTFPNSYVTEIPKTELLDTGGAVVNERHEIVGLVTGRGLTTGKLYVARTDDLVAWLSPKVACGGAATSVRTYGVPGGDGGGASSSSGSSSGTSGSYGTPGSSGSSGSSGEGTGTGRCNDGGGNCSGDCGDGGNDGVPPGSSSSGSSGTSGGSSGSSGSTGTIPGSSGSSGGTSGTSGTPGSSGSSDIPASSGGGGGTDIPGGDGDVCTGESDNPELCPPEPDGCTGSTCGGGVPDDSIDYGGCACGGGNGDGVIVR